MEKYHVVRCCAELVSFNPESMTAVDVKNWFNEKAEWGRVQDCEESETIFDTLDEARLNYDNEQPSSFWERSSGNAWILQIEYFELQKHDFDEFGELSSIDIIDSKFAAARF